MGRYVYLEDEEIDVVKENIEDSQYENANKERILDYLYRKLSQKPKTLEELGFNKVSERREPRSIIFENRYSTEIKFDDKGNVTLSNGFTCEELEAILNKAKEMFVGG